MIDHNALGDQNETPEDVATLYSWANLHGAKYRDFTASRAQSREKARQRVQDAINAGRHTGGNEAETALVVGSPHAEDAQRAAAAAREAELAAQHAAREAELAAQEAARQHELAAQQAAQLAAQQAAQVAAQQAAQQAAQVAAQQAAEKAAQEAAQLAALQAAEKAAQEAAQLAAQQAAEQAAQEAAQQQTAWIAEIAAQQAAHEAAQQAAQQQAAWKAEIAAQQAAQQAAQEAAQQAAQEAAQQAAWREEIAAQQAEKEAAQQRIWQQPLADRFPAPPAAAPSRPAAPFYPPQPQQSDSPSYPQPQASRPEPSQPQNAPAREESYARPRFPWSSSDLPETADRPAWLAQDRMEIPSQPAAKAPPAPAPDDTLQGSRERMTSRWFALRGVFEGGNAQVEAAPAPMPSRAPAMAVFSLAGGVGKTSMVATLGRALAARGERVLLVDTAAFGLLPFFFGARDQRPGMLRTFSPPGVSSDAPIQMVAIDPESLGPETPNQETLIGEISKYSRGVSRVIIDLATASGATTRRVMRLSPLILVPVIPDMNSVVSVSSIDDFFQRNGGTAGKAALPYYVLNQFDPSLPLHLDVREVLRERLGDRLLSFALRRAPAMSEALAEGMTVMDYAPNSTVAEDFGHLAGWVKSLSAPASTTYRGVRWSER